MLPTLAALQTDTSITCADLSEEKLPKEYLDSGFQADVFTAGDDYVVKVAKTDTQSHKDQFDKECKVLRKLQGIPRVIRCVAACDHNGKPALILSRAYGKAFKKTAIAGTPNFERQAVKTMLETGMAVLDQQIVNTDQQPNILFDEDGTATFIDFGAAVLLDSIAESFQDFYVPTYLRELYFLIPNSQIDFAEKLLQKIDCRRHAQVMQVFDEKFRNKRNAGTVGEVHQRDEDVEIARVDVSAEIIRKSNDMGQCPAQPCHGVPVGIIVECLSGKSFDLVYARCCDDGGAFGSKSEAIKKHCAAKTPSQAGASATSQLPVHDESSEIVRVNSDAMVCPAQPCRNVPTGKIAECLSGQFFDFVYARCCHDHGVLGSKAVALNKHCS